LGGGVRLFDDVHAAPLGLEYTSVIESPSVTHLRLRVPK
jgi:hypothetical protein